MAKVTTAVEDIYGFFQRKMSHCSSHEEDFSMVKEKLKGRAFIWQCNRFHEANHIVFKWSNDHFPYLCELSSENQKYRALFAQLGVNEQPSADLLGKILSQIAEQAKPEHDRETNAVSDEVISFIEVIIKNYQSKSEMTTRVYYKTCIYLPDENCVMQPVKCLACDKVSTGNEDWVESLDLFASQFEDSAFHFIHPSIPRERAITLGVKPL
jgi:hypothetical protein